MSGFQLNQRPIYGKSDRLALMVLFPISLIGFLIFLIAIFALEASLTSIIVTIVIGLLMLASGLFFLIKLWKRNSYIKKIFQRRNYNTNLLNDQNFKTQADKASFQSEFSEDHKLLTDKVKLDIKPFDETALIGQPKLPEMIIKEPIRYRFYDVIIDIYSQSRYGSYKVSQQFYTIFEIKLRQTVPHLLFDSKTAKKQQFKTLYVASQKLEAAANFDQYFNLYSPKHHAIESLSFITPEVIEAMIDLKACDFEFIGDSLLCYAPLLNETQLSQFRDYCLNLHAKINDNLPRYELKTSQIDSFGRKLLKRPLRYLPMALVFTALAGLLWQSFFRIDEDRVQILIWAIIISLAALGSIFQIIDGFRQNKASEDKFLKGKTQASNSTTNHKN